MFFEHASKNKKTILIASIALVVIGGILYFYGGNKTKNIERDWTAIAAELKE